MARKAYTQELDDVASWFRNCGIDELTPETVSNIILGWRPESVLDHKFRPTKRPPDSETDVPKSDRLSKPAVSGG